jgi:hypothetical protein
MKELVDRWIELSMELSNRVFPAGLPEYRMTIP